MSEYYSLVANPLYVVIGFFVVAILSFVLAEVTNSSSLAMLVFIVGEVVWVGLCPLSTKPVPDGFAHQLYEVSREEVVTLDNRPVISGRWHGLGSGALRSVMYYSYYTKTDEGTCLHEIPATDITKMDAYTGMIPMSITRIFEDSPKDSAYILEKRVVGHKLQSSIPFSRKFLYTGYEVLYELHVPKGSLEFAVNLKINGGE